MRVKIRGSNVTVEISVTFNSVFYFYHIARKLIMIGGLSIERLRSYELFAEIQKMRLND
jgi:hypothetical protein